MDYSVAKSSLNFEVDPDWVLEAEVEEAWRNVFKAHRGPQVKLEIHIEALPS